MMVSKALSLITNKYSVSLLHCIRYMQHSMTYMQHEMIERHVRALNRIANNFKSGIVSPLHMYPHAAGFSFIPLSSTSFLDTVLIVFKGPPRTLPATASVCGKAIKKF